ncbi:MAG: hypothetical protein GQ534_02650 [Candidatus Delongbacteria bacterium]|nr:hypothetical protein [Candidatus Delongbacteria bacterium]
MTIDKKNNDSIKYELGQLSGKVQNIERVTKTIETLAEHGFESWNNYLKQKNEREKRESELTRHVHEKEVETEDKKHKRSVVILGGTIAVFFILIITAMILEQYDLVKIIINSSLAIAAGAGVGSMFRKEKKEE